MAKQRQRRNTRNRTEPFSQRLSRLWRALQRALRPMATLIALAAVLLLIERGISALYAQPVTHIAVAGKLDARHRDAVRDTVAMNIDGGLLALDLAALREELEQLPWIYRATLRREFPGTLRISVIEQLPIARWGDSAFLNHEARIIEVADEQRWETLPMIRGQDGSQARLMNQYQRFLELLRPLELSIRSLEEDAFGQLSAELDNGIELQLGSRDFSDRVDDFLLLWRRELRDGGRRVLSVDMRYADGAAVAVDDEPRIAAIESAGEGG